MEILLTDAQPGPYIIPRSDAKLADQGACLATQAALVKFLDLGTQIGEPTFMYTHEFVAPIVRAWAASVKAVAVEAITMKLKHDIEPNDPVLAEAEKLRKLASFYLAILDEVAGSSVADQRDQIYRFILRPLFWGLHYRVYFDDESGDWAGPSLYCAPQRLANRLGLAVNGFRALVDSGIASLEQFWDTTADYWGAQIHDLDVTIEEVTGGLAIWWDTEMAPAVEDARKVAEASLKMAQNVGTAVAAIARSPVALIALAGVAGWVLWKSKRR